MTPRIHELHELDELDERQIRALRRPLATEENAIQAKHARSLAPRIGASPGRRPACRALAFALSASLLLGCDGASEGVPALGADGDGSAKPDVVLVVIDTLRADHLPSYGYPRQTAPNLEALADEALVFDDALSVMGLTLPAHVSIMTGIHPWTHHIARNGRVYDGPFPTLAERLSEAGYQSGAFVSGIPLAGRQGLDRGFDRYRDTRNQADHLEPRISAEVTTGRVLDWLEELGPEPFFLFVHYYDTHTPYNFPADRALPFREDEGLAAIMRGTGVARRSIDELIPEVRLNGRKVELPSAINAYDNAIHRVDSQLGELLSALDRIGRADRTLLIVTSDHGEGLGQHGYYQHQKNLYEEQLHIPLIVRPPALEGVKPGRVRGATSQLDIAPTILDFAGLAPNHPSHGHSFRARMGRAGRRAGTPEPDDLGRWTLACRLAFAKKHEGKRLPEFSAPSPLCVARGDDAFKYLRHGDGREEVYDLNRDPGEQRNLAGRDGAAMARLRRVMNRLEERFATGLPGQQKAIDPALREQLEALGYAE